MTSSVAELWSAWKTSVVGPVAGSVKNPVHKEGPSASQKSE